MPVSNPRPAPTTVDRAASPAVRLLVTASLTDRRMAILNRCVAHVDICNASIIESDGAQGDGAARPDRGGRWRRGGRRRGAVLFLAAVRVAVPFRPRGAGECVGWG